MRMPAYLEGPVVPRARIAELSVSIDFTGRSRSMIQCAKWHCAKQVGTLEQTIIIPEGDEGYVQWGLTTYDVPDEPSTESGVAWRFAAWAPRHFLSWLAIQTRSERLKILRARIVTVPTALAGSAAPEGAARRALPACSAGYLKAGRDRIEKDPDQRVQGALKLLFAKFAAFPQCTRFTSGSGTKASSCRSRHTIPRRTA